MSIIITRLAALIFITPVIESFSPMHFVFGVDSGSHSFDYDFTNFRHVQPKQG